VPSENTCVEQPVNLIPGVYKYCDDWCNRCPVTARCLSYRIRLDRKARAGAQSCEDMDDMVAFTRELAGAAGESTDALDAVLAGDPHGDYQPLPDDEWLVETANQYAWAARRFLRKAGWTPPPGMEPGASPTPLDVLAWYSFHLAARASRALIALARAERGCPGERHDALGCARIAHIGIDRCLAALRILGTGRHQHRVPQLEMMLRTLSTGLETRLPGGRDFIRVGLDAPVV
jgi:hypothetical protein